MQVKDFALEVLNRTQDALEKAVDGLSLDEVMWQPKPGANHIAFILWHILRVEDWFFQYMFQRAPQVWESEKWHAKLNLPDDPRIIGFGYTAEQVDNFPHVELRDLLAYGEAVRVRTLEFLRTIDPARLDKMVTSRIFGEVSIGQLIAILICDRLQHVGQIAYLRGLMRGPNR